MTFGQLATFLAVARTGSIRAAAAQLVVTEPSVSAAVTALSRELGADLTERVGRGIRLTPAGRELAGYAARIVGLADRAGRTVREVAGHPGSLRLIAVTTAGEYVLPPILAAFFSRNPGVHLSLDVVNRAVLLSRLENEEADLAVGGRPPQGGGIEGEAFRPNPLVVVARADHPLRPRRSVDPARLAGETWLLREPGSGTREATEEFLREAAIEPHEVMEMGSNGAITRAVALGLGVTLTPREAVEAALGAGELALLRVRGTPIRRSWYVLYRRGSPLPPSARAFLRFLRTLRPGRPGRSAGGEEVRSSRR